MNINNNINIQEEEEKQILIAIKNKKEKKRLKQIFERLKSKLDDDKINTITETYSQQEEEYTRKKKDDIELCSCLFYFYVFSDFWYFCYKLLNRIFYDCSY